MAELLGGEICPPWIRRLRRASSADLARRAGGLVVPAEHPPFCRCLGAQFLPHARLPDAESIHDARLHSPAELPSQGIDVWPIEKTAENSGKRRNVRGEAFRRWCDDSQEVLVTSCCLMDGTLRIPPQEAASWQPFSFRAGVPGYCSTAARKAARAMTGPAPGLQVFQIAQDLVNSRYDPFRPSF